MSIPGRSELVALSENGKLIHSFLQDEWGFLYGAQQEQLVRSLSTLHNDKIIDVLSALHSADLAQLGNWQQSRGQLILIDTITRLDISAKELISALQKLSPAGPALVDGKVAVAAWCEFSDNRPLELLELYALSKDELYEISFVSVAIRMGIKSDSKFFIERAYELLSCGDAGGKKEAVYGLYSVDLQGAGLWQRLIQAFGDALDVCDEPELQSALLKTSFSLFNNVPEDVRHDVESLVLRIWSPESSVQVDEVVRALAFGFDEMRPEFRLRLLSMLKSAEVSPFNVSILDIALSRFFKSGDVLQVRGIIEFFLRKFELEVKFAHFDSVIRSINSSAVAELNDWTVAWLRSGDFLFGKALDESLIESFESQHIFEIDFESYRLADAEYGFIARKSIAAFFLKPKTVASLIISLARSANDNVRDELEALLFTAVLINYPSLADSMLETMAEHEGERASDLIKGALRKIKSYLDGVARAGNPSELRPSEREYQLEWQRSSDEMNDAMRNARRGSFISQIATESLILYGNGMVSWVPEGDKNVTENLKDSSRRIETAMTSFTHSMQIPRQQLLDPVGLDKMLLSYITEKSPV
ncbi:hypothetical protein [Pseudomonas syringae group genomosp. 3]|uniref:hypothetical protein n=1 Tax=Pseudomonas syringae group genomosp. 3 TaxID=251701 RepID=UPI001C832425|nr:hypothetical protein [Pseudomonas syringae group genomosp. 3]MBX6405225.1 hypothetical protein [Pseudomonas syringae pv. tomato]MBX6413455.1 hypothetical protein [Pseudomonas syringae pv. tomato]MBX6432301.1 hypothetical protein [Pseudomonas syringae pv. tomato]MBX6438289.1 hypothetical protein [Pseudomonas syringae pv. tomato]MBX6441613.1 hypothetical protein [Pseudomonas syringae pv. tomato]